MYVDIVISSIFHLNEHFFHFLFFFFVGHHFVRMPPSQGSETSCPDTTRQGDRNREPALRHVTHVWDQSLTAPQYIILRRSHGQVTKVPGRIKLYAHCSIGNYICRDRQYPSDVKGLSKLFTREGGAGADGAISPYVGHLQLISTIKISADCCQLCQYKLTKPNQA